MKDELFDAMKFDEKYEWWAKTQIIDFGGRPVAVELCVKTEEEQSEISEKQKNSVRCFLEKWSTLQETLIEELIEYYNEDQRFAWGPDDEEEFNEWWPEIETKEALLNAVTLETILIPRDFLTDEDERCVYLLFSRTWGGEDDDDNGIGVCIVNEEIDEIAYKDIAF